MLQPGDSSMATGALPQSQQATLPAFVPHAPPSPVDTCSHSADVSTCLATRTDMSACLLSGRQHHAEPVGVMPHRPSLPADKCSKVLPATDSRVLGCSAIS